MQKSKYAKVKKNHAMLKIWITTDVTFWRRLGFLSPLYRTFCHVYSLSASVSLEDVDLDGWTSCVRDSFDDVTHVLCLSSWLK
jgi:hypothetical protein